MVDGSRQDLERARREEDTSREVFAAALERVLKDEYLTGASAWLEHLIESSRRLVSDEERLARLEARLER